MRDAHVRKGDWYQCVKDSAGGFESTFTARDKTRHAQKRRILAHAFSERALRQYEPRIKHLATEWISCLTAATNRNSVDFAAWANYLIFDILGDLCYGKDFGLMHSDENRYITRLLPRTTRSWYMLGYHPWSHFLRYLLFKTSFKNSLGRIFTRDNARFREFCVGALMERIKSESESQDMFHHLLKARDPQTGEGFSKGDLGAESVLLMIAGTHTTSIAIASIVHHLARNQQCLERVTAEVKTTDMHYPQLSTLPYLRACINESLRLCPPTAGHLQREILSGGAQVDGVWYQAGTNVGISAYALQRNPLVWSNPDQFLPERWLQDGGKTKAGFIAFSSGPLACPGKQLAYMEMTTAIAMLVHHFEIVLDESHAPKTDYVIKDCYVGQARGPQIILRPHSN